MKYYLVRPHTSVVVTADTSEEAIEKYLERTTEYKYTTEELPGGE